MHSSLLQPFHHYNRLSRQGIGHHSIVFALEEIGETADPRELLSRLWLRLGRTGEPKPITAISPDLLPLLVHRPGHGWGVAEVFDARGHLVVADGAGGQARWDTAAQQDCVAYWLPPPQTTEADSAWALIKGALRRHRATLIHAGLATALINLVSLVASVYSMQVYDRVVPTQGVSTLVVLTAGALMAALFEFVLKWLRSHTMDQVGALVDADVSRQLVTRLLGSRLDARPAMVGTLAAQVKGFDAVRHFMTASTLFFIVDLPFALLFVAVIGLIGGWAVAAPVAVVFLSLALGLFSSRRNRVLTEKSLTDGNRKMGALVEAIEAGETLKANRGEWRMVGRWSHLVEEVALTDLQLRQHNSAVTYLVNLLQGVGYVALVAMGALLIMDGHLTMGGLLACTILNGRAVSPLLQLPALMVQWSQVQVSIRMLDRMLAMPAEVSPQHEQLTPQATQGELHARDLRFGYAESPQPNVVLQAPLLIQPGERVGVLGEIGSGKSTLLKLLAGLYRPQGGQVLLDGVDMVHLQPEYLRHAVAFLAQDYRLVAGTLRDNLTLGLPDPGDQALEEACRRTGLIQLVNSHPKGLALQIGEGGRGVSGGQRQLIGLTRLMLSESPVWLLDEPTASLDGGTEARVLSVLGDRSRRRTLVVVTHKANLLPIFDRLIIMGQGRVLLDGPRETVMARLQGSAGTEVARA